MPTRLACLLAATALFLVGCTRVAFRSPTGKPVPASDEDTLKGEWLGEKGIVWTVDRDPKSGLLRATGQKDGKFEKHLLVLTSLSDSVNLIWVKEDDLGAYVPLRISGADDAMALLYADEDAVKKQVAAGKLTATFDEGKKAWIVAPGDWAALLERPDFWRLDQCLPFVRAHPSKAPAAPAPGPSASR